MYAFILLIVVVDIVIVGVIILVAIKKLQPRSGEEEVKEALREIKLTMIKGIGSKRAKELKAVGVNTVSHLATASAKDLSQKISISEKTISRWIEQANEITE
jgi:predicted flap endonuclease-1-like 5' DNA nuclease